MRHRVYGKKLGRDKNERTALFKSLVQALFLYGTIETSESKAKAVKGLVDKIINLAKDKNTQRLLKSYFFNKQLELRLIKEIAPKLSDRVSGYTTILRLGTREGDRANMVRVSLINNEKLEPMKELVKNPIKNPKKIKLVEKNKLETAKPLKTNKKTSKGKKELSKKK